MKKLLFVLLACLLFFGCISSQDNGNAGQGNGNAGGEGTQNQGENYTNTSGGAGVDYSDMNYNELIALGTPLKCIVTMEDGTTSTMYLKGGKIRIETMMDPQSDYSYDCETLVQIVDAENYISYFGCEEGKVLSDCDWIKIETSPSAWGGSETYPEGTSSSSGVDTNILGQLPAGSFSCIPDNFGDEMFEATGKVCDMFDMSIYS